MTCRFHGVHPCPTCSGFDEYGPAKCYPSSDVSNAKRRPNVNPSTSANTRTDRLKAFIGPADHVEDGDYVLCRTERGGEIYYVGGFNKTCPKTSGDYRAAKRYASARAAYNDGRNGFGLDYFRAVKLYGKKRNDNFRSLWWCHEE